MNIKKAWGRYTAQQHARQNRSFGVCMRDAAGSAVMWFSTFVLGWATVMGLAHAWLTFLPSFSEGMQLTVWW